MEYKCKIISASKMLSTPLGFSMPLCNDCKTLDCTNPIEKKKVSVVGVVKELKMFSRGDHEYFVVSCVGYSR